MRYQCPPFRKGVYVYVGETGDALCPVAAMLAYLGARGSAEGPLFRLGDGRALSRLRFVVETQKALQSKGKSSTGYSGHSFRCGAATTAAEQGLGEATIMMLGRWSSVAYRAYIKTLQERLARISPLLAGCGARESDKCEQKNNGLQ